MRIYKNTYIIFFVAILATINVYQPRGVSRKTGETFYKCTGVNGKIVFTNIEANCVGEKEYLNEKGTKEKTGDNTSAQSNSNKKSRETFPKIRKKNLKKRRGWR